MAENTSTKVMNDKETEVTKEKKRVLRVSFDGKELLEDRVFDTTSAETAKKYDIYNPKREYKALDIITGEHELLPLVEKELMSMKVGEEKKVKMSVKEAFGERKANLVRVVPLKVFHDQKINPIPGLVITVGNAYGKVQSISGGRVRVDFNHALAGREIEYRVKVEKEITDKKELAELIFDKYYSFIPGATKEVTAGKVIVGLGKDTIKNLEQINTSIKRLASDLGVEIEFKEIEVKENKKEDKEEKK
jgi:FKBP-type peptidyl-prolyl cis-trans isomerase SlyD